MRILFLLVFFSLATGFVSADSNSNAVNERITVTPVEMESHWQVDCATSWARAIELREKAGSPGCALPPDVLRELKLCSFIYQPPGQQRAQSGPDYQSAAAQAPDAVACLPETHGEQYLID
jgi:hypothetical protein